MNDLKAKELTWGEVYQLPLKYDGYNYAWASNDVMSLMFDDTLSDDEIVMVVKAVNGEVNFKIGGLTKDGCDFFKNGTYIFCVRGWGNLIGGGALSLPVEKALEIQNGFINHVYNMLA